MSRTGGIITLILDLVIFLLALWVLLSTNGLGPQPRNRRMIAAGVFVAAIAVCATVLLTVQFDPGKDRKIDRCHAAGGKWWNERSQCVKYIEVP